jgi:hypothetical protein
MWGDKNETRKVDVAAERRHEKQSMVPDYRSQLKKEFKRVQGATTLTLHQEQKLLVGSVVGVL